MVAVGRSPRGNLIGVGGIIGGKSPRHHMEAIDPTAAAGNNNATNSNGGGGAVGSRVFEVSKVLEQQSAQRQMAMDETHWARLNSPTPKYKLLLSRASRTLSFATPMIVEKLHYIKDSGITLIPFRFRMLLAILVFFYFGFIHSYSGWISSYSMILGVTASSSDAATLTSTYYSW